MDDDEKKFGDHGAEIDEAFEDDEDTEDTEDTLKSSTADWEAGGEVEWFWLRGLIPEARRKAVLDAFFLGLEGPEEHVRVADTEH